MSSREFPHCGLIRPGETEACECGWSFRLNAPAHGVLGMGPSARERGERRFQSGYGLTLVAVGLLILLARAALGSKVRGSRWCWRHVAAATVLAAGLPAGAGAEPMAVRIMAMLMSDFEAQPWLAGLSPTRDVAVPGLSQPVRCTQDGVCLAVLGEGPLNAAASVMSLGLAADLDLSHAYFLIAGIAGTDPAMATIGSVAWADWIVDADSVTAVHPADLPDGWEFPRFRRWCSKPWCDDSWGVGALRVHPTLVQRAMASSRATTLLDDANARAARARYSEEAAGRPPSVLVCSSLSGATYWHGRRMSEWARWWVDHWTDGRGRYCMTDEEDFAVFATLHRLSSEGGVDVGRILAVRGAANFDQPYPGQSTVESLQMKTDAADPELAIENVWRVGEAFIQDLMAPRAGTHAVGHEREPVRAR